jgi:ATP synthase protein I
LNQGHSNGKLERAIERRRARQAQWDRDGERSLARNLALAGSLGWLIVAPTVLGAFAGRALDRLMRTGVTFTGALIFLGAATGSWLAWRHVRSA